MNKSYFVDPVPDQNMNGFICYCFLNQQQIDRRLFRNQTDAENYGCDWIKSSYKRPAKD